MDDKFFENFYNYKGFSPAIQVQEVHDASFLRYGGKLPTKLLVRKVMTGHKRAKKPSLDL